MCNVSDNRWVVCLKKSKNEQNERIAKRIEFFLFNFFLAKQMGSNFEVVDFFIK